jgi:hypothetical protein
MDVLFTTASIASMLHVRPPRVAVDDEAHRPGVGDDGHVPLVGPLEKRGDLGGGAPVSRMARQVHHAVLVGEHHDLAVLAGAEARGESRHGGQRRTSDQCASPAEILRVPLPLCQTPTAHAVTLATP